MVPDVTRALAGGDGGEEFKDIVETKRRLGVRREEIAKIILRSEGPLAWPAGWRGWWVEKHS